MIQAELVSIGKEPVFKTASLNNLNLAQLEGALTTGTNMLKESRLKKDVNPEV